jgi:hypothetical protein
LSPAEQPRRRRFDRDVELGTVKIEGPSSVNGRGDLETRLSILEATVAQLTREMQRRAPPPAARPGWQPTRSLAQPSPKDGSAEESVARSVLDPNLWSKA